MNEGSECRRSFGTIFTPTHGLMISKQVLPRIVLIFFIESMAAPSSQPLLKGWNQHVLNNCRYLNNFNKKCCFIYLLYVQNCSTCAGFSVGDPARAESKGTHLRPDRRGESGFSRPIARCGPRWKRIQQDRSEGSNGQSEDN